jgi:hypothetical protein
MITSIARNLAGHVQIELHVGGVFIRLQIEDAEAIRLCDRVRGVIEDPTLREPTGENVTVMKQLAAH